MGKVDTMDPGKKINIFWFNKIVISAVTIYCNLKNVEKKMWTIVKILRKTLKNCFALKFTNS